MEYGEDPAPPKVGSAARSRVVWPWSAPGSAASAPRTSSRARATPSSCSRREDEAGGRAREAGEDRLPEADLRADVARVAAAGARVRAVHSRGARRGRAASTALSALAPDVDAVYLAVGAAEADAGAALGYAVDDQGRIAVDPVTLATSKPGIYCGGGMLRPSEPVVADRLHRGRQAGGTLDRPAAPARLARGVAQDFGGFETGLIVNLTGIESEPPVRPADPASGYSPQEATSEAERCLQCACLECVKACTYLEEFGAHPGQYARRIYNNLTVTQGRGSRSANKMIDSCSLCRLCYEVCPTDLDMAEVIHAARREMVRQGRMPRLGLRLRRAGPAARRRRAVRAGAARSGHGHEQRRVLPRLSALGVGPGSGGAHLRVSEGALLPGHRAACCTAAARRRTGPARATSSTRRWPACASVWRASARRA